MKLHQLTFTRFLAAFAILVFHAESKVWPFNLPLLHSVFSKANVGVSYFFILSGFVMVVAYGQQRTNKIHPVNYYINRLARIYPMYLLAFILVVFKLGLPDLRSAQDHLLQLLMIQAWIPGHVFLPNIPAWSLSVEVVFYAAFPLLFNKFYSNISIRQAVIVTLVIWLSTQVLVNGIYWSSLYKGPLSRSHDMLMYFPLMHLNEFMVGNVLGLIYLDQAHQKRNLDGWIMLLVIAMFGSLSLDINIVLHDGLMAVFFGPLILLMALNNGHIPQVLSNKWLLLLGEASYGIYILQYPVKIITRSWFGAMGLSDISLQFYLYCIILIIVSILCYYLIEMPAKHMIKSLLSPKHNKTRPADDKINL